MSILHAIILGLLQGATEFLPISSSGHLALAQYFLGAEAPNRFFDIILHVGTLLAIISFYRKEIWRILKDIQSGVVEKRIDKWGIKLAIIVVVASVPTAILGLGIEKFLPTEIDTLVYLVCSLLFINGFILMANKYAPAEGTQKIEEIPISKSILLGLAQGFAVLPGISRSGTTITSALFFGIERTEAAMISFLLSIPAIAGAVILKFDIKELSTTTAFTPYLVGALIAGVSGYIFLSLLVTLLQRAKFHYFAWYCWGLSIFGIIFMMVK